MAEVTCCETDFFLFLMIIFGLVVFAGLMAGLTLGLMSLGLVDLEVLIQSGRPRDRIHACKLYCFIIVYGVNLVRFVDFVFCVVTVV